MTPRPPRSSLFPSPTPFRSSSVHGFPSDVQMVPAGLLASAGQEVLVPSQLSAGSHSPPEGRQVDPAGLLASAGQVLLAPLQASAGSHSPPEARHSAPALPAGCWQLAPLPSH